MAEQSLSEHQTELMTGYVLNALSADEQAEFEQCLAGNPALADEVQQLQEVMGLMAHAAPQSPAPAHLRRKVMSVVQPSRVKLQVVSLSHWNWGKIAAGVAALLILGLGVQNHLLLQRLVKNQEHEEQTTFSFTLKGLSVASQAGEIVLDLESGRALFAIQNLPPLASGEVYSLWAVTAEKNIFCGTFTPSSSGQIVAQIAIPINEYGSPVTAMKVFRGVAGMPTDLKKSTPIMTSLI